MITIEDYVGPWAKSPDWTKERQENALRLLHACSLLEFQMKAAGIEFPDNPITGTGISGQTFGGFRPQACKIGANKSNHKEGLAVDRYDPQGAIDQWCIEHLEVLEHCGIYLENPKATNGWSHWQCVPPRSGRTVFMP